MTATGAFDCDTHIYETRDAATRYLPKKYLDKAIRDACTMREYRIGLMLAQKPGLHRMMAEATLSEEKSDPLWPPPEQQPTPA